MPRISFLTSIVTVALVGRVYAAIGPVTNLTISNAAISPDGYTRDAVVMNGVFPGPLITGNKGDNFQLNVTDNLTNHTMLKSTSVHWHGLFQKGTNWADGAASVNQCPIASGHSFLYNFTVPDQAGTFWYHSHLSTQYCDGLRGPMVVYDPQDPHASLYDVDNDSTVITVTDWYHVAARLGPRFPFGTADSTLINGLGRYTGPMEADLAVISVTQGMRYRFRLVSMSCDPWFTFSIDNHTMNVIEADAVNTKPLAVDSIPIFPGQRYSFVLTANQSIDNYWIRANPNFGATGFTDGINSAILRYDGAAPIEPASSTAPVSSSPLVETDLHPLESMPVPGTAAPGGVDKAISLTFSFDGTDFYINNVTFVPPSVPVLLQILNGAQTAQDLLPAGSIFELPSNSSIEITMPAASTTAGPHPMHLHGHVFAVVRSAGSTTYNYDDPIWRDVVSTGTASGDSVTIRFRTDNPGPWFLHCHIDFHLEAGLAVVMAEAIADTAAANPVPPAWEDLCPIYDALDEDDQ